MKSHLVLLLWTVCFKIFCLTPPMLLYTNADRLRTATDSISKQSVCEGFDEKSFLRWIIAVSTFIWLPSVFSDVESASIDSKVFHISTSDQVINMQIGKRQGSATRVSLCTTNLVWVTKPLNYAIVSLFSGKDSHLSLMWFPAINVDY